MPLCVPEVIKPQVVSDVEHIKHESEIVPIVDLVHPFIRTPIVTVFINLLLRTIKYQSLHRAVVKASFEC